MLETVFNDKVVIVTQASIKFRYVLHLFINILSIFQLWWIHLKLWWQNENYSKNWKTTGMKISINSFSMNWSIGCFYLFFFSFGISTDFHLFIWFFIWAVPVSPLYDSYQEVHFSIVEFDKKKNFPDFLFRIDFGSYAFSLIQTKYIAIIFGLFLFFFTPDRVNSIYIHQTTGFKRRNWKITCMRICWIDLPFYFWFFFCFWIFFPCISSKRWEAASLKRPVFHFCVTGCYLDWRNQPISILKDLLIWIQNRN